MTFRRTRFGSLYRQWRASWRDTLLLLRDFRGPILLFALAIIGGGLVYFRLTEFAGEGVGSPAEAIYTVLTMVFLQTGGTFPHAWYLQVFYFLMPVVGIAILAQGLAEFGVLFFNRRARSKEWEMAVASTLNNHVIVVGLGHLGYRVLQQLREMDQDVAIIELEPDHDLLLDVQRMGIPIIQGDASREGMLEAAGIKRARVLVLCTQNDSLNLQIGVKARSLNPDIQVVMRIFDDDFAQALQKQFHFSALSATGMAAPVFASLAAGMDISHPITVEGQSFVLARMNVRPKSRLVGMCVSHVEHDYHVSVVLLGKNGNQDFHPEGDKELCGNDVVAVLGGHNEINRLAQDNR